MIIKKLNNLDEDTIKDIRKLELICKEYDSLEGEIFLDNSLNFNPEIKNIFLAYEENKLVSLIYMFIPIKSEAEISAYTMPEYRKKGYFKELLLRAIKELKEYEVKDILFVCEPKSYDGKETIKKLHGKYDFTEYTLKYNKSKDMIKNYNEPLIELYKAELKDIETLVSLNEKIFSQSYEEVKSIVMKTFKCHDREQYLGVLNGAFVGIGAVSVDGGEATIFDFGVLPKHQGEGIGKDLLRLILEEINKLNIENIVLEVNSENEKAFNLYRKCGFEIQKAIEYHRKTII